MVSAVRVCLRMEGDRGQECMIDASRIGVGSVGALPKKYIYISGVPLLLKCLLIIIIWD